MKVLYKSGKIYLIRTDSNSKYNIYYGDGNNINGFGVHPVQFLRFNAYMDYVEDKNLHIPQKIKEYILKNSPNDTWKNNWKITYKSRKGRYDNMEQIKHGLDLPNELAFEQIKKESEALGTTQEEIDSIDFDEE